MTKASNNYNVEDDSVQGDKTKRKLTLKIFRSKKQRCERQAAVGDLLEGNEAEFDVETRFKTRSRSYIDSPRKYGRCFSGKYANSRIDSFNPSNPLRLRIQRIQDYRICAATWNAGGKSPNQSLIGLEKILQIEQSSDIYVLGFQEIVPLNAGNVLVLGDNEPAAKWLDLISQTLNKPRHQGMNCFNNHTNNIKDSAKSASSNLLFFQKPSLKDLSRSYGVAEGSLIESCNCMDRDESMDSGDESKNPMNYTLISSKQMVGLFLSVWVRSDLVQSVGHLRTSSVGRGIMGRLGNKGCISISMSLHQTSFCFVCSHLASGEKQGDELRRNSDVAEILKNTQFPKICKSSSIHQIPEKILDHDRVIWLGDLNYRVSMSYDEAKNLLVDRDWDGLLQKDQLMIERGAERVFKGWKEGRILFAPTYKYSHNSDSYAGETVRSKKKRRTPAWCDRVLWYGKGIEQLSYEREESKFSDHRPVRAIFSVETQLKTATSRNKYQKLCSNVHASGRYRLDDCAPRRQRSFYNHSW